MVKKKKKRETEPEEEDYFAFLEGGGTATAAEARPKGSWPEEIPVLTQEDLTWNYSLPGGRRDLLEWLGVTFLSPKKHARAQSTLLGVINEWAEDKSWSCLWYFLEYVWKKRKPSLAWQAAAWNEAMSRLGYEVPEKKRRQPRE